jgi:hypothetical protein
MTSPSRRPYLAAPIVVLAAAAPWALGFSTSHAAVANAIAFAMAFVPLALMAPALRAAAVVCVAGGAWLVAAPWVLAYPSAGAGAGAWAADAVLGAGLVLATWRASHGAAVATPAPAAIPAERDGADTFTRHAA